MKKDYKNIDFSKYEIPIEDDKKDYRNIDFSKYEIPIEEESKKSTYSLFSDPNSPLYINPHPIKSLSELGEKGKQFIGGALEGTTDIGRALQKGLLDLGSLISKKDLSKYATPRHQLLNREEETSPYSQVGHALPYIIPYERAASLAESVLPEASRIIPRIGRSIGSSILGGGIPSAVLNPDERKSSFALGSLTPLAAAPIGKLISSVANGFSRMNLNNIREFLKGGFEKTSNAMRLLKEAFGSNGPELEGLAKKMGSSYQKHAIEAGKHINYGGEIRPLIRSIEKEEQNPVYNRLEETMKDISSSNEDILDKGIYNEAIDKAGKLMSQSGKGTIPAKFMEESETPSSPLEAYKRYREINRILFHGQKASPDVKEGASLLKEAILKQISSASKKEPDLEEWLKSLKKADNSFRISTKYEQRYPGIEQTYNGMAPESAVNNLLNKSKSSFHDFNVATKDFGDIRNELKNALLHKEVGSKSDLYDPLHALNAYESLPENLKNILFDKNQRKVLDTLSRSKEAIRSLPAPKPIEHPRETAHAGGFISELAGEPYGIGSSIPWIGRLATSIPGRVSRSFGEEASTKEIERGINQAIKNLNKSKLKIGASPTWKAILQSIKQQGLE